MRIKKIFKYTGIALGSVLGVGVVGLASVWFSSSLTGKVLNYVATKVPGLSWDKVEGSFSSGVKITNLSYVSQNYKYNPAVTNKPEEEQDQPIPTLLDIRVGTVGLHLQVGCLVRKQLCLDNVEITDAKVVVASGNEEQLDPASILYGNQAVQTITTEELVNPDYKEESSGGPPSWLDIIVQTGKVNNVEVLVGKNIGLYQYQLNHSENAAQGYRPVIADLNLEAYPSSIYNQYLAEPMLINLDSLSAQTLRYRPTAYDLNQVAIGKVSYQQYSLLASSQSVDQQVAQNEQDDPASAQPAGMPNPNLKGRALPPEVQDFIRKYFNLQADSFSQAFSQLGKAFALQYSQQAEDFKVTLPDLASDEELEQLENGSLLETSPEVVDNQELWRALTGYEGEFKFVEPTGVGKDNNAKSVSRQISSSFDFFKSPARNLFLTNTQLNLPIALTTSQVEAKEIALGFYTYKVQDTQVVDLTSDLFAVNNISLDGNLAPEAANFKAKVSGDVELDGQFDFLARTSDTNLQLKTKINKLPLVTLPVGVDLNLAVIGKAYSKLDIALTNQAPDAQVNLELNLDTARPYWPLTLVADLNKFVVNDNLSISNFNVEATGRINNLKMQLASALALNNHNYQLAANLINLPNEFASELTLVEQAPGKQAAHAYVQLDYGNQIVLQSLISAQSLQIHNFANLGDIKDFTLSGTFNLGGIYNSQQDWSAFFKESKFNGTINQKPFNGNLLLGVDAVHGILVKDLSAAYLTNSLQLQGALNTNSNLNIKAHLDNLTTLVPKLKINSQVDLTLAGNINTPAVKGTINTPLVQYQSINMHQLVADLDLAMDQELTGKAAISLAKSNFGEFVINRAKVNYNGAPDEKLTIDFSSNQVNLLANLTHFTLSKETDLTANIDLQRLDIVSAELNGFSTNGKDIELVYNIKNNSLVAQPFEIKNSQFNLTNNKELVYNSEKIQGQLSSDIKLELLNPLLRKSGIMVRGQVKATADVDLNPTDPNIDNSQLSIQVQSQRIDYIQKIDVTPFTISLYNVDLTTGMEGQALTGKGSLKVNNQGNVTLDVKVADIFKEQKLSGSLILDQLSLNVIKPFLDNTQQVTGTMYANLVFGGNLRQPLLYGQTGASRLNVEMVDLPFSIKNGDLVLAFDGRTAVILGSLPTDSTEISINGSASWSTIDRLNSNVRVTTTDLKAKLLDYGVALLDIDVTADYVNNFLDVKGTARVHDGTLTVASSDSVTYEGPTGDVVFVTNDTLEGNTIIDGKPNPSNMLANIKVTLGDNLKFDAYGVNAELVGELDVTYASEPTIIGNITINNGIFRQYGQNLVIQRGEITFNGLSLIPNIYIRAIRDPNFMMDNVTVGVQVQGLATKPNITLFSTPASLTQNQKINYLLTGSSTDDSTDGVGLQLFTSSLTSSISLFEKIGNAFGIKNTQVTTSGAGENSKVNISGTVFNRVRLNYAYGLFDGLNTISASYYLLPKVFLRVSRGVSTAADVVYSTTW
ncbi:hypothetical protein CKF54_00995 [Psittacicella hinzii]|uniref:Translocation and assembly module TamB C-terminal domain-containing protein n=1 Tax=Psittacicella hinzii TaxID=2028575 RepID=A0A3A1YAS9_9GAMM|nr:translocation/assembly module TamB domain-containing protein [Psittacicella hinzii]RIY34288.1 hypothetical protein CKF54_00995 [Psittacicella hinzii]